MKILYSRNVKNKTFKIIWTYDTNRGALKAKADNGITTKESQGKHIRGLSHK